MTLLNPQAKPFEKNTTKASPSAKSSQTPPTHIVSFVTRKPSKSKYWILRGITVRIDDITQLTEPQNVKTSRFKVDCSTLPTFLKTYIGREYSSMASFNTTPEDAKKLKTDMTFKGPCKQYMTIRRDIRFKLNQRFEEKRVWSVSGEMNLNSSDQKLPNWQPISASCRYFKSETPVSPGDCFECAANISITAKFLHHKDKWCWKIKNIQVDQPARMSQVLRACDKASAVILDKEDNVLLLEKNCVTENFTTLAYRLESKKQRRENMQTPEITDDELKGLTRKELKCLKRNSHQDGETGGTKLEFIPNQCWGRDPRFSVIISGSKDEFHTRIDRILSEDFRNEPGTHKLPRFEPNQRIFTLPGGKIDLISWEFDDTIETSLVARVWEEINLDISRMERLTVPDPIDITPHVPPDTLLKSVFNSTDVHVYKMSQVYYKYKSGFQISSNFCGLRYISIHELEEDEVLHGDLNQPIRDIMQAVKENNLDARPA